MAAKIRADQPGRGGYQTALPLKDEDSLVSRDLTVCERTVSLAVRLRVIRFVLLEDVVDGSQQHKGDGDDGLLVTTALLQS